MTSTATSCDCSTPTNGTQTNSTTADAASTINNYAISTSTINNNVYFLFNIENEDAYPGPLENTINDLKKEVEAAAADVEESKQIAAEKQAEHEQAVAEEAAGVEASEQVANVRAFFSQMLAELEEAVAGATKQRSSGNITRPENCSELINMTAEMNTAVSLNTLEGMNLGTAYATAILEDPTPSCSDEELEDIRAVQAELEATESSINAFVTAAQEAVANATSELAARNATTKAKAQELEEKEAELQKYFCQFLDYFSIKTNKINCTTTPLTTNTTTTTTTTTATTTATTTSTTTATGSNNLLWFSLQISATVSL